ncbi:hypothetical protein H5410_052756 [Solanum commersonii]|uniref:Uncharacterized protein n=1 Tax=Solanum commersonii TaxID=4109 RepID=A0A9J5X1Q2_SOLCO|nr:hypothetical protein H5410_052756 [Solanum commersonii]
MTPFQDFRNVLLQEKIYNDIKDFFKSYQWGKECFDISLKYLKNKINLKKQSEVYKERRNASYALYGFPWAFLHTAKSNNIVEGDPFKYKGRSTMVVHPYIIPIVCETKQNYMATFKSYTDEVKDTIIDALKASLKGVIVLTSAVGNVEDEYSNDHNPNQPCENSVSSTSKDEIDDDNFSSPTVDDNILPLDVVDDDLAAVDAYFAKEVDKEMKEEEMKEEEKQQDEEKMTEKEEEKMKENDEEKEGRN